MLVRKIGDIFEYNGEKYQVSKCLNGELDPLGSCNGCAFKCDSTVDCIVPDIAGMCSEYSMCRDEDVIFIKLEKN